MKNEGTNEKTKHLMKQRNVEWRVERTNEELNPTTKN
jgi:hypothetical protein